MISFRYHLVSIVAVFLALALGVLVGTTVVNQGIIDDLRHRTDAAAKNAENLRKQVAEQRDQLSTANSFEGLVFPLLVRDQLTGAQVLLVTQQDVDASEVDGVRHALIDAGASVVAELVVTSRMALPDDSSRTDLATALGTSTNGTPEQLAQDAANAVGSRLALGSGSSPTDLLDTLRSSGFVIIRGGSGTTSDIGGSGQAMVLVSGSTVTPTVDPSLFLAPLASALVQAQRPVAAAESETTVAPFVPLLRDDGGLDGHLVTVDNADGMPGRVALVLGLRNLLASPGDGGDYGVKAGASTLIPRP